MKKNRIRFSLKRYTFMLLVTCLLGTQIVSFDLGSVQLSPYRLLLLASPLLLFQVRSGTKIYLRKSNNYSYFVFLLFWVVYSLVPLFWIKDFSNWVKIFTFLASGCVISWFIGWYLVSKEDILKALKIVESFGILFGIIALYEIFTGNFLFITGDDLSFYQERSLSTSTIGYRIPITVFSNPNDYALFLLFAVFASLGLSKIKETTKGRLFSIFLTLFFLFLLIATQSRSAFIGLSFGAVVYLLFTSKRGKLINSVFLFIFIGFVLIPWLIENVGIFDSLLTIDFSKGSDATRLNLIRNGIIFLEGTFFMGVGLGNIEYYMENYSIYNVGNIVNIHNWWLEILVSSGVIVFLFYLYIYFKNLWRLMIFPRKYDDRDLTYLSICFCSFLCAFMISSVGSSSLMNSEWLWPLMAIIMSFINLVPRSSEQKA